MRTIPVGGSPDSIVVDCWSGRNDVVFYDLASSKIKYLDGDSLAAHARRNLPAASRLRLVDERMTGTWATRYLLQVVREVDWDNLMVTVLNRRTQLCVHSP